MARSIDFCFKTMYVSMFLRFISIVCCFQCFVQGSSPFGKVVSHEPPTPRKLLPLNPPSPFGISNGLPWGGMDIFWNHALLLQIERIETRYLSWIANSDRLHVQSALLFWLILLFCFVVAEINNLWRARARKTIIYK